MGSVLNISLPTASVMVIKLSDWEDFILKLPKVGLGKIKKFNGNSSLILSRTMRLVELKSKLLKLPATIIFPPPAEQGKKLHCQNQFLFQNCYQNQH